MTQRNELCPKCSHLRKGQNRNQKCLSIEVETGLFKCHHPHCGYSGRKDLDGTMLSDKKPRANLKPVKLPDMESNKITDAVYEYLEKRKLSRRVVDDNGIGWNGKELMFPYFRHKLLVNIKYRTLDKKWRQQAGGLKVFYGLDDINGPDVIICEGEMDKIALNEAGFKSVLSVPDGAPSLTAKSYDSKFSYIEDCADELKGLKKIILAVDSDAPGKKLEEELTRRLGPERCWRVTWPNGCKDANAVLVAHSEFELIKIIDNAAPVPIAGLFSGDDYADGYLSLFRDGQPGGQFTGWHGVDQNYTVSQGQMTIVTGIPSHGKSEFIDALMVNLARTDDWRFGVFSPENFPVQNHMAKLAQKYIKKSFNSSYGEEKKMTEAEAIAARKWITEHFAFIAPPDNELTVDHIISKAKVAVMRYGIKGLMIDPWNEIDHSRPSNKSETEYISECLTKIRRFARTYRVHVWLIAHPTKLQRGNNGKYPVPNPYDIAGSAHFRNKADNCITAWRDLLDEERAVEIHIQKIRFREVGKVGMVKLKYDISNGCYSEMGIETK